MLSIFSNLLEAGIDEAGRGPLCGPVYASAVIWDTYLETFEEILGNVNKVIIDTEVSQSGVLPFLPLPELNNKNRTVRSGGN